jgi:CheY-like chemotaxis protein
MNPDTLPPQNRRWLLVDDDLEVLAMLALLVENLTTATIECHPSPRSAYAAFSAAPTEYELVITDFEMPGMNGVELSRWLRAITPSQIIFLATGGGRLNEMAAHREGLCALLAKPFTLTALKGALARAGIKTKCVGVPASAA